VSSIILSTIFSVESRAHHFALVFRSSPHRCIFVELLATKPCLPGKDEIDQLTKIFKTCGSPTEENWPGHQELPHWGNLKPDAPMPRQLRERYKGYNKEAVDLLDKMLALDPKKRITAEEALDSDYFWMGELACDPEELPKFNLESCHEFEAKARRKEMHDKHVQRVEQQQAFAKRPRQERPAQGSRSHSTSSHSSSHSSSSHSNSHSRPHHSSSRSYNNSRTHQRA
jgi:serine/threonine protein kinase